MAVYPKQEVIDIAHMLECDVVRKFYVELLFFGKAAMPLPLLLGDCIIDNNLSNLESL